MAGTLSKSQKKKHKKKAAAANKADETDSKVNGGDHSKSDAEDHDEDEGPGDGQSDGGDVGAAQRQHAEADRDGHGVEQQQRDVRQDEFHAGQPGGAGARTGAQTDPSKESRSASKPQQLSPRHVGSRE